MHEYKKLTKEGIIIGLEHAEFIIRNFPGERALKQIVASIECKKKELAEIAKQTLTAEEEHA